MKMSEPIGNPAWGPFFVRVALGGWFFMAGMTKLEDLPGYINQIKELKLLPDHLATLYALLLPYLEILAGFLLLIGFWTTAAAILASLLIASFLYAFGVFPGKSALFNKDFLLLAGALSLMFSGAGALSVDKFRKSGG